MAIWDIIDHVSPIKVIEALGKAADGEFEEAGKILTTSAVMGEIKDKVRGGKSDNTSDDDVD